MAFSGASHRPHSSGACPPRGQSSGPLSPESPRPLRATQVPGPVVLQPRRLPTPSRSGDLWTFLGAPPRSSTRMTSGRFGFPVGCRGHGHPRVRRVVRTPPPGCEHTGEQILLTRQFHFTSLRALPSIHIRTQQHAVCAFAALGYVQAVRRARMTDAGRPSTDTSLRSKGPGGAPLRHCRVMRPQGRAQQPTTAARAVHVPRGRTKK